MSTITPTSDQRQIVDHTDFTTGDNVRSNVDGRLGVVATPYGQLPSSTPTGPLTSWVDVNWADGTTSTVLLSTLSRA